MPAKAMRTAGHPNTASPQQCSPSAMPLGKERGSLLYCCHPSKQGGNGSTSQWHATKAAIPWQPPPPPITQPDPPLSDQ